MDNQNNQYVLCPGCHNYEFRNMPQCRRCGYVFNNQMRPQQQYYPSYQQQSAFKSIMTNDVSNIYVEVMNPHISGLIGMILALVGLIGSAISVFMPFITASAFGVSQSKPLFGNSSDAYAILFFCVADIIVVLCKCKTYGIDTILSGVFLLFIAIYHYLNTTENINEIDEYSVIAKVGAGNYMLIICGALVIIGGIVLCVAWYNKKHCNK